MLFSTCALLKGQRADTCKPSANHNDATFAFAGQGPSKLRVDAKIDVAS